MEHTVSLDVIQNCEFKILQYIRDVCERNGLRYYLAYGTLIGAVRHQGFIPWDDDMDIHMPRQDFLKFVEIVTKNPHPYYRLLSKETSDKYSYVFAKVSDTRTRLKPHGAWIEKQQLGLYVDIFILDGAGDSQEEAEAAYLDAYAVYLRYRKAVTPMFYTGKKNRRTTFSEWVHAIPEKSAGARYWMDQHEALCTQKNYDACNYVAALGAGTPKASRNVWPRDCFGEGTDVLFNGETFRAPADWDAVLTPEYGDYMELPPPKKRRPQHKYTIEIPDPEVLAELSSGSTTETSSQKRPCTEEDRHMRKKDFKENSPDFPIDFVVLWVDGSDPEWQKEKNKYQYNNASATDSRDSRYRDWNLLKYWFRGVEKFAPWVNRVYFVTCGHVPEWLNLSAPKLVHVKHSDYMPPEYLPTFSSHPIELNLHRIADLSEHFVYFNDDMFLLRPVSRELFFRDSLPVYPNEIRPITPIPRDIAMANIYVNDINIINSRFDVSETLLDKKRWFSLRTHTVKAAFNNLLFHRHYARDWFIGFRTAHFAAPTLKSSLKMLWEEEPGILDATSRRKFRDPRDINQYILRYWYYATNRFAPEKPEKIGKYFGIKEENIGRVAGIIKGQEYPQICINDIIPDSAGDILQRAQEEIHSAFESILPEKSSFEK